MLKRAYNLDRHTDRLKWRIQNTQVCTVPFKEVEFHISNSFTFFLANSMTCVGNWANSATCNPKLRSHAPGMTWYNRVKLSFEVRAVTWRFMTVGTSSASRVSSWKCVANRQKQLIFVAICLEANVKHDTHNDNTGIGNSLWNCPCKSKPVISRCSSP